MKKIKEFFKSKKGNYVQLLMLAPLYLVLMCLIAVEINFEQVRHKAENAARIVLRAAVRCDDYASGIDRIVYLMNDEDVNGGVSYGIEPDYNIKFYTLDAYNSWVEVADDGDKWVKGNIIELSFVAKTSLRDSISQVCLTNSDDEKNCVTIFKNKAPISCRMVIEGGD